MSDLKDFDDTFKVTMDDYSGPMKSDQMELFEHAGIPKKLIRDLRLLDEGRLLEFPEYRFNEDVLLEEFSDYVDATYGTHYSKDQFQATEFIIDGGHGTGFCIGNILKYAQRYGKKGTHKDARKDLLKVMHYALIQLYIHDTMKST